MRPRRTAGRTRSGVGPALEATDYRSRSKVAGIHFAINLRCLRHEKGLSSQDDLAYEAEVSRSYLAQLEKGVYFASLKIVGKLADALGVEPAEFLRQAAIGAAAASLDPSAGCRLAA